MIRVDNTEIKRTVAKLVLAIEKSSNINPKAGWIEIETLSNEKMVIKVANYDYFLEAYIPIMCDNYTEQNKIHATITAETFIPLISRIKEGTIEISERLNSLILATDSSEYTFPIIKELRKVKSLDSIKFNRNDCYKSLTKGENLASVAKINVKGLVDALFSKEEQKFIYVDNKGALTFTENIYVNDFEEPATEPFKMLLTATQAKLLKIFEDYDDVEIAIESSGNADVATRVQITSIPHNMLTLTMLTQSVDTIERFPSVKIRGIAETVGDTHVVVGKKVLEEALARLMVFDKKFDVTVMNYSKLVFEKDFVKLVSIKNNNYEIVPYVSTSNAKNHEAMIRFADIVNQLKAIQGKEIDISYGHTSAVVFNSGTLKQLIPEIKVVERV